MGWMNDFKIADRKKLKTRDESLVKLGMSKKEAYCNANTRKGYWRIAHNPVLRKTFRND